MLIASARPADIPWVTHQPFAIIRRDRLPLKAAYRSLTTTPVWERARWFTTLYMKNGVLSWVGVSVYGRARSITRTAIGPNGNRRNLKTKYLKASVDRWGYPRIAMRREGKTFYRQVHSLVCLAFHGTKPTIKHETAHNDGVKINCAASNLRWATRSENHADKIRHGTSNRGTRHGNHTLTEDAVRQIRELLRHDILQRDIAETFNVSQTQISHINRGGAWGWLDKPPTEALE